MDTATGTVSGISNLPALIGVALAILVVLVAYAWHLQRRLKLLEQQQRALAKEAEHSRQQKIQEATQGIRILAGAMVREEVTITEGCMRIAYLLTQVDASAHDKQQYSVFFQLASATAHIPVLGAWQELSKQEKTAYTKERAEIEQSFSEFVLEATQGLLKDPLLSKQIREQ